MTGQDPVVIDIANPSGFGLAFGSSHYNNTNGAPVDFVTEPEWKEFFAHSEGYITFDGGPRKNISIRLSDAIEFPEGTFAAPVYFGPGTKNITIKNCRIEGVGAMRTSYDIPKI